MKKTDKIYILAFICVTLFILIDPMIYILLGKKTTGTVVRIAERRTRSIKYPGSFYHAVVDVTIDGVDYRFWGKPNITYPVGQKVRVAYLPWGDHQTKILDFKNLFVGSLVYIAFFFVITGGMKIVFPNMFEPGGFDIFRK